MDSGFSRLLARGIAACGSGAELGSDLRAGPAPAGASQEGQTLGSGDERMHVIPALSAPTSVKNGGKPAIQALVKAAARWQDQARIVAEGGGGA